MKLIEVFSEELDFPEFIVKTKIFELIRFPETRLNETYISFRSKEMLVRVGLPEWVAPHLHFGEFDENEWLPELSDWSWRSGESPEEIGHKLVLGNQESPICIEKSDTIVLFDHTVGHKRVMVNENPLSLLKSLTIYQKMIDIGIEQIGRNVCKNRSISKDLGDECLCLIGKIDQKAAAKGSFWYREVKHISSCGKSISEN